MELSPRNKTSKINDIPKSTQNEKLLIGCIIKNGQEAYLKVSDQIKTSDFWDKTNQKIYKVIEHVAKTNGAVTYASVIDRVKIKASEFAKYMGANYSMVDIDIYVKEIKRTSNLRKLISAGAQIEKLGFKEDKSIEEILQETSKLIAGIEAKKKNRLYGMSDMVMDSMQRLDERVKNKGVVGVSTGFEDLDKILHGFSKGALYTIAARPGVGKTSLMVDMARKTAKKGNSVLIFSLEQPFEEIMDKMTCGERDLSVWGLKGGYLNDSGLKAYTEALGILSELDIKIDDNAFISPAHIRSVIEKIPEVERPDVVMIDYMQLMGSGIKTNNRVEEVTYITQQLKAIAKEYSVPVVGLAQLNRGIEHRSDKEPMLSDLRDSGSIEQDSDVVMFLSKDNNKEKDLLEAELIIAKHRGGPIGIVNLMFHAKSTSYTSIKKSI